MSVVAFSFGGAKRSKFYKFLNHCVHRGYLIEYHFVIEPRTRCLWQPQRYELYNVTLLQTRYFQEG